MKEKLVLDDAMSSQIGIREQLFNEGETGEDWAISTKVDEIALIRGILLDIDPKCFRPSTLIPNPKLLSSDFYEQYVSKWLDRHETLRLAEVRGSGSGVHVILRPAKPIELRDQLDRRRWHARATILQAILPTDPKQPGINAMTRKIGSINEKNGETVTMLRQGGKLTEEHLLALVEEVGDNHFSLRLQLLAGKDQVSPCPICGKKDSRLGAKGNYGYCYKGCGQVGDIALLEALFVAGETDTQADDSSDESDVEVDHAC